ncbi:NAD(P)/FAD-dependent oxidoreductase [Flavobacterium sp.]|uniref:NAD(P)/FAD-dependent oxidoreductase n=1 Tax=Flavobacterium sp. TaxID=239 RepID=UPI0025C4AE21|nr:NAD(P)/FAD-dependent oxidoreductase [Flavobacterium sp.]
MVKLAPMLNNRVIIIGGGLAGLTAAIHLSKIGTDVTLVEKQEYPKHKVCGEYISNEVLPYLKWLGVNPMELDPAQITKASFSTVDGKEIHCDLPLGGFGISRYALDNFLYKHAVNNGCAVIRETVSDISFDNDQFTVTLSNDTKLKARVVIGAHGKRSNIDQKLDREFIAKKSPWLAVKAHYSGDFPDNLVGLHNFNGGYCGVSKVENGNINVCYLADFESFKKYRNIEEYQAAVVCENPRLNEIFDNCVPLFDQPLTISQISFEKKEPIEKHVLMIGDTAGLIHPLCGNGMAMAIHSAKLASECLSDFLSDEITREKLEENYTRIWNDNFSRRLKTGRLLASALQQQTLSHILLRTLLFFPSLLPEIIKMTHGKPLKIAA